MSLFKQLVIMLTLFLSIILASVMLLNFKTASEFVQNQLYSDAKNTAHSLGLSLSKVADPQDQSTMETMINAIFDSGYYEHISLTDIDGKLLYERKTDVVVSDVPKWFIDTVKIESAGASSDIMMGWSRFGTLQVSGHRGHAYQQLYSTLIDLVMTFLSIGLVVFVFLYLLLSLSLKSLKRIRDQAQAIIENQFIFEEKIPFTTEFRSVTVAMNTMVGKVKDIFEREDATLKSYQDLLYKDTETKLYNRRYLIATLPDFLATTSGMYVMFSFEALDRFKREMGYEHYRVLMEAFSQTLTRLFASISPGVIVRLNEGDFFIVLPNVQPDDVRPELERIMKEMQIQICALDDGLECYLNLGCALGRYDENDTAKSLLSRADHVVTNAKMSRRFGVEECQQGNNDLILGREEWRNELILSMETSRLLLASQSVVQRQGDTNNVIHEEVFLRLRDVNGTIHSAGYFIPVATSLGIVDTLDRYMIDKVLEKLSNNSSITSVALNLSGDFIKKYDNVEWLKNKLEGFYRHHKAVLWFEVSNTIALQELEAVHSICTMIKQFGYKFGIDHFVLPHSGASYLQIIRPDYVKSNSAYLEDMLGARTSGDARESLKNVVKSLGILMIAIAIEEEEQIDHFRVHGLEHFQGSFVSPVTLL